MLYHMLLLLIIGSAPLKAQLDPLLTQYMYNKLTYNPAFAGSRDGISGTLGGRALMGVVNYPLTFRGVLHTPIQQINSGIGVIAIFNRLGITKTATTKIAYACHVNLPVGQLNIGMDAGLVTQIIKPSLWGIDQGQGIDSAIPQNGVIEQSPDLSAGLYYFNDFMYSGFSVVHLLPARFSYGRNLRHYYLTTGYKAVINEKLMIEPSFLIKSYEGHYAPQVDFNTIVKYAGIITGMTFRFPSVLSIGMLTGYSLNNTFRIVYSYDIPLDNQYLGGAHEVSLNLRFNTPW